MLNKAKSAQKWFALYDVVNNNRGDFVRKVAGAGDIGYLGGFFPNNQHDLFKMNPYVKFLNNSTTKDLGVNWATKMRKKILFNPFTASLIESIGPWAVKENSKQILEDR